MITETTSPPILVSSRRRSCRGEEFRASGFLLGGHELMNFETSRCVAQIAWSPAARCAACEANEGTRRLSPKPVSHTRITRTGLESARASCNKLDAKAPCTQDEGRKGGGGLGDMRINTRIQASKQVPSVWRRLLEGPDSLLPLSPIADHDLIYLCWFAWGGGRVIAGQYYG